jgi:glycosyltransferase involved in cell wall biosynthesis
VKVLLVGPAAGPRTGARTYAERVAALLAGRHAAARIDPDALARGPGDAEVVHILDAKGVLAAPFDGAWARVPLVVDLHDDYWRGPLPYPAFDRPARAWRRSRNRPRYLRLLGRADAVVVHAESMRAAVPHDRVTVVPIPAEPAGAADPSATRAAASWFGPDDRPPEASLRVLFAGRDALRKGLPVLGRALRLVRALGIGTRTVVAGDDWLHLRAAARWWLHGVPAAFPGELDGAGMEAAWRWADVFVLPAYVEAFGLAAQEALLRGVPVVASRVGGLVELCEGLAGTQLVPPGSAAELAGALVTVARDRAGWRERAEAGGRVLLERRTPAAALEALEAAYSVASQHLPAGPGRARNPGEAR